jgi:hypothetical protein
MANKQYVEEVMRSVGISSVGIARKLLAFTEALRQAAGYSITNPNKFIADRRRRVRRHA